MNVGMTLANRSLETIYYKVTHFHALTEGRGPNTDKYIGLVVPVPSASGNRSHPDAIDLRDLQLLELKGTIHFSIKYGRQNDMKYTIERRQEFHVVVHKDDSVKPNAKFGVAVIDKEVLA
jgi:hypothetical protein